jgi:hypothetical protein
MSIKEVRKLVFPQNPFVLGNNPSRPAPQHILNGFVAASLGTSDRGVEIKELIAAGTSVPEGFDFIEQSNWKDDPAKLSALRNDLSHVFNPDGRMWKDFGSPVPVHGLLANSDPSDDGFGPLLWRMMEPFLTAEYERNLRGMFFPEQVADPVTACAMILVSGAKASAKRTVQVQDSAWFGPRGTKAGSILAASLTDFLQNLTRPATAAKRLFQVQHLERGLYLTAVLALLMGPLASSIEDEVAGVEEISAMVAWADMPPGPPTHPMVAASGRSLQILIERMRVSLAITLSRALSRQPFPSTLPEGQRLRFALAAQLGVSGAKAEDAIERLSKDAGVEVENVELGDLEWCNRVVESAYSTDSITKGLRSMGNKVGFIGPGRGVGTPRFFCETPLLGTLIAGLCPEDGIEFESFVDLARHRLGIVFGPGTEDNLAERLNLWEGAGIGGRILRDNQDALRERLVRAGLAREYSDGHTEVIYDA